MSTIHLRKSKPVMVAAGAVWILVAISYGQIGQAEHVEELIQKKGGPPGPPPYL